MLHVYDHLFTTVEFESILYFRYYRNVLEKNRSQTKS